MTGFAGDEAAGARRPQVRKRKMHGSFACPSQFLKKCMNILYAKTFHIPRSARNKPHTFVLIPLNSSLSAHFLAKNPKIISGVKRVPNPKTVHISPSNKHRFT